MKKLVFSVALLTSFAAVSFASTPKSDVKASNATKTGDPVSRWFHFNGNASSGSDLTDPSKYVAEDDPQCSSTSDTYRCDIYIQTAEGDEDTPDLSQPVQDQRKRTTAQ